MSFFNLKLTFLVLSQIHTFEFKIMTLDLKMIFGFEMVVWLKFCYIFNCRQA